MAERTTTHSSCLGDFETLRELGRGGMTIEQVAQVLNVSEMTVKRDWEVARTWLLRELSEEGNDGA